MSTPQHIHYGRGGTPSIDLLDRPSNALCSAYKGDGTAIWQSRTCNVSAINTTLNAAVAAGAMSVVVNSNTGFAVGGKFWLQDDPEELLCRQVAGGTIHLRRPVMSNHIAGATVEGTRVSYSANSTDANTLFWDGYVDWNIDGQVSHHSALECTKYPMQRVSTVQDVLDEEPMFYHLYDPKMDIERTLDLAHQDVLSRIAAKSPFARARVFPGSPEFVQAEVFAFLERLYRRRPGEDARRLREQYERKLSDEIERVCGIVPRDADQDGKVEATERLGWGTIRIRR